MLQNTLSVCGDGVWVFVSEEFSSAITLNKPNNAYGMVRIGNIESIVPKYDYKTFLFNFLKKLYNVNLWGAKWHIALEMYLQT